MTHKSFVLCYCGFAKSTGIGQGHTNFLIRMSDLGVELDNPGANIINYGRFHVNYRAQLSRK
jgi:hypothetical protein